MSDDQAADFFCPILDTPLGHLDVAYAPWRPRDRLQTARLASTAARHGVGWRPDGMPLTKSSLPSFEELTLGGPQVVHVASFESVSRGPSFASKENYGTTLDMLFVGSRVCVCGQPQTCGEVVRVVPMTGRVVVRLDPPHPAWRGTLRSFRPERLVIYS
ncbi:MAG: hypothetical protein WA709_37640 [Stellaceae bacterium]